MEKASASNSYILGYGEVMRSWRRSLINPGDKKTPTDYYAFGQSQKVLAGTHTYEYYFGDWYSDKSTILPFNAQIIPAKSAVVVGNNSDYPRQTPVFVDRWNEMSSEAENGLIQQVIKAKDSDFNAAVFLAEAGESVRMIATAASRTYRALRALRKGDLNGMYSVLGVPPPRKKHTRKLTDPVHGISHSQTAAGYWNEVSYGWLPLYGDANNAAVKLAKMVTDQAPILSVGSGRKYNEFATFELRSDPSRVWTFTTEFGAHRFGLSYRLGNKAIAQASSLGLTNPFLVAWETIPLSFVFDWWLPIGNFLETISAFHGLEFCSGYHSSLLRRTSTTTQLPWAKNLTLAPTPEGGHIVTSKVAESECSHQLHSWSMTRGKMLDFPSANFPKFAKTPLSLQKAVSAVALLRQRLW